MVGAMLGAVLASWSTSRSSRPTPSEKNAQPTLGIFSTGPEIRNPVANLITEIIATIALVLPILAFGLNKGIGIGQSRRTPAIYGSGISSCCVAAGRRHRPVARRAHRLRHQPGP